MEKPSDTQAAAMANMAAKQPPNKVPNQCSGATRCRFFVILVGPGGSFDTLREGIGTGNPLIHDLGKFKHHFRMPGPPLGFSVPFFASPWVPVGLVLRHFLATPNRKPGFSFVLGCVTEAKRMLSGMAAVLQTQQIMYRLCIAHVCGESLRGADSGDPGLPF